MEKIKFVMTDTDPQVSALCRHVLEEKGVSVTICEKNGAKALETLLTIHPQAVLLDAFMPDLDAITVKQRYEAQNTSSTRTTFFVTGAFQSEEIEQELLDSGFSFFFVKPFDETVLVSRVLKAAGNTARPQLTSLDSDELTVTEILHQIGVPAHIKGYQFLRDAIRSYYADHGVALDMSEIFVSDGAKSDLGNLLDLFSQDNTILVPDPVYPVYVDDNVMAGRKILYLPATAENHFLPMPDEAPHADIVYICSPNNPTGATLSLIHISEPTRRS